ncbi:MAG: NADH-quinone oxidoreductase subunit K [Pseudomonadota bacterium]
MGTSHLEELYLGILLTLIVVVVARNFKISVWFYMVHSFLLGCIYLWYATHMNNPMMYLWFASTFLSQIVLIPFAPGGLFYTIRRYKARETEPIVPFGVSIVFITILVGGTWQLFHYFIDFIAPTPGSVVEPSRSNLAIAFTIFALGIYTLLTRRDAIKTVIGLCILGNGIDLTLVDLTPTMAETAILGILTDVIISVFILLYISRLIYVKLGIVDTVKLSQLRH